MRLHLENIDVYPFKVYYGGALFTGPSTTARVDRLCSTMFTPLGPTVIPSTGPLPSLFCAAATEDNTTHVESILVANAGSTTSDFSSPNTGLCSKCTSTLYAWTNSSLKSVTKGYSGGLPPNWSVHPDSVGLFAIDGSSQLTKHKSAPSPRGKLGAAAGGRAIPPKSALGTGPSYLMPSKPTPNGVLTEAAERLIMRADP